MSKGKVFGDVVHYKDRVFVGPKQTNDFRI